MNTLAVASHRFPDLGRFGNAAVLLALLALAVALAGWQVEPWQWFAPGRNRVLAAAGVAAAYAGFVAWLAGSRQRSAAKASSAVAGHDDPAAGTDCLVVHASQTGQAEAFALRTVETLRQAGQRAALIGIDRLDETLLKATRRALFVASTTGEGDAPDMAAGFVKRCMGRDATAPGTATAAPTVAGAAADGSAIAAGRLAHLEYAVLALGDSDYSEFCAFGHRLAGWLRDAGARALFDVVEVDNGDPGALRHWQYHLGQIGGSSNQPDWARPDYRSWSLRERRHLNPGSPGGPVFDLALHPQDPAGLAWQAGDIAEIGPRHDQATVDAWLSAAGLSGDADVDVDVDVDADHGHGHGHGHQHDRDAGPATLAQLVARSRLPAPDTVRGQTVQAVAAHLQPLPHREYSIASTPAEGVLRLLVRQVRHSDGRLGIGSGWLGTHAPVGGRIDLRIRRNTAFHRPPDDRPLLLIGNGTGLAGLRALLAERIAAGHRRNWLLFGERTRAHDLHYRGDLERWQRDGGIERLELAFSRDQPGSRYVQHLLGQHADELRRWLDQGASVYVCGSLQGMAPAVDAALAELIGAQALETMTIAGRYRRDVY